MACNCCKAEATAVDPVVEICGRYKGTKGALIPVLQETQKAIGYLSEASMHTIARELKIPVSQIFGVVTFYTMFHLKPRGKNIIKLCQGTACHVKGAKRVLEEAIRFLKVEVDDTTADGVFTLETVACVGTCFLAPVMMVNNDYYGEMTPGKVHDILPRYREQADGGDK